jgi:hypothetical protein
MLEDRRSSRVRSRSFSDGHVPYKAMSYMPTASRDIAANIVLYALMDKPKPEPKPATTQAAEESPPAAE